MKKLTILFFVLFMFTSFALAREYTIATNETSSGNATLENDALKSGNFGLIVETSGGSVDITFTVYEDDEEVQTLTFDSTSAEKVKYWSRHGTGKLKVAWTITDGTVAKVTVVTPS